MKDFTELTRDDVEKLRRKKLSIPKEKLYIRYDITEEDIEKAKKHLEEIHPDSGVYYSFAAKMYLLHILECRGVKEE